MSDATYDFGLEPGESFEPDDLDEAFDLTQPHVMTVLGPIDPGALGVTLHHEHVIAKPMHVDDPDLTLDSLDAALAELEDASFAGVHTVVDMTPVDYGRDAGAILWIAQRVPVHIVVVTGHHKHAHAASWVGQRTAKEIAAIEIDEIRNGIAGTTVRPGLIKAGSSLHEITEIEQRQFQAAAIAHLETGVPISTHTEKGTMALEQIAILQAAGVSPERIIIGHLDFALDDEPYLRRILETGAFLSFDQVSKEKYAPDSKRAEVLHRLAEAGHLDRLLFSGDLARKSYWLAYGGRPGLRFLVESFPVILMEAGFSASEVRQMLVDNPQRALTTHL